MEWGSERDSIAFGRPSGRHLPTRERGWAPLEVTGRGVKIPSKGTDCMRSERRFRPAAHAGWKRADVRRVSPVAVREGYAPSRQTGGSGAPR